MNYDKLIILSSLEYVLLKFFERVDNLTQYDNNDHPDVIWGQIRTDCEKLKNELKEDFEVLK